MDAILCSKSLLGQCLQHQCSERSLTHTLKEFLIKGRHFFFSVRELKILRSCTPPVTEGCCERPASLVIHSGLALCTGTGKTPPRPFHHRTLQPPRSLREERCPKLRRRQRRLPGGETEEVARRQLDSWRGPRVSACRIPVGMQPRHSDRRVGF